MSRKIISTFTAAAMSMSIALAVPVGVTAVSSLTVVSEAEAGFLDYLILKALAAKHKQFKSYESNDGNTGAHTEKTGADDSSTVQRPLPPPPPPPVT
jgi:hypothetical protein